MNLNNHNGRDKLFFRVLIVLSVLMILFGTAALVLALTGHPSDRVIFRVVTAVGGMFTGILGIAVGYMAGRR